MKKAISWSKYEDIRSQFQPIPNELKEEDSNLEESPSQTPAILTSFGMLPLYEGNLASDNFDFWIMYTNFDITKEVVQALLPIKGVESIEPLTRYRARIGFPIGEMVQDGKRVRMFDVTQIKKEIEKVLLENPPLINIEVDQFVLNTYNEEVMENFLRLKDKGAAFDYWAVLILPNGGIEHIHTDCLSDYLIQENIFSQTAGMTGGTCITHNLYKNDK